MQERTKQNLAEGDLVVESIGAELRFWSRVDKGYRNIAKTIMCFGERSLLLYNDTVHNEIIAAPDLTVSKVYKKNTAELLNKYFPDYKMAHLYYAGNGPSGHSSGWEYFSIPLDKQ